MPVLDVQGLHPAPHADGAADLPHLPAQDVNNASNPFAGPGQALAEDALEHHDELAEFHVALCRVAVDHQWAEEHIDQQGIGQEAGDDPPAGHGFRFKVELVVLLDAANETEEIVLLGREVLDDLLDEELKVVVETERSEEHTSELQSLAYLVCRLLLEKKKIYL